MWHNHSNYYEDYSREDREREREQWENQTPMESFNRFTPRTSQDRPVQYESLGNDASNQQTTILMLQQIVDIQRSQLEEMEEWNQQHHYEPQTKDMDYGWNREYQHEPSNVEMEYGWNHEHHYVPSNEETGYVEEYGHQQESFDPNLHYHDSGVENHQNDEGPGNPETISMLQQILEGLERVRKGIKEEEEFEEMENNIGVMENNAKRAFKGISERLDGLALHYDSLKARVEIEEVSNDEDMVQGSGVCDVFPEEYDVVDEHQRDCTQLQSLYEDDEESIQFQEDESSEDVQDAQFPFKEEIEEIPKDAYAGAFEIVEVEVADPFPTDYEIVVEHQDDQIYTQQQSPAGEEVVEFIQLHEDALDEDALALIVSVTNEETLRLNKASTEYAKDKEEEEVIQLFELSQKELHQDEAVEPRVPGTPTPRLQHPQGLRKRLEWRIKHKWKIKLHNV